MAKRTCARRGCSVEIPVRAALEGDPYCSTDCCRLDHGLAASKPRKGGNYATRKCSGCGVLVAGDDFTPGCRPCNARKALRRKAGTLL
jgi:hypothetical protein